MGDAVVGVAGVVGDEPVGRRNAASGGRGSPEATAAPATGPSHSGVPLLTYHLDLEAGSRDRP